MNGRRGQVLLAVVLGLMTLLGVVGVLGALGRGAPAAGAATERVAAGTVTETLMALYDATGGASWINSDGWGTTASYCTWHGVTCDTGEVVQLNLNLNNLSGAIPPELGELISLQNLYLGNNDLSGAIPPELAELISLQNLYLSSNRLSGAIPPELGSLPSLQYLYLSDNNLSGAIPPELGSLNGLESLYLSGNDLSGPIPRELGALSNLRYLYLHDSNLSGPIPAELAQLSSIWYLDLTGNPFLTCWETEAALASVTELGTGYSGPNAVCFHVDWEATNGAGTGASWGDAFTELQPALVLELTVPGAVAEVWVAEGTYRPTAEHGGAGDRFKSFQLKNGVALYGGFDPSMGDVALEDRNWEANRTVLSGDLGVQGDADDNSYHVFYHPPGMDLDSSAILDGFTITGGNADGMLLHSEGGGMNNAAGSSPLLRNCTFSGNRALAGGGMLNGGGSGPVMVGCIFEGNSALYLGAGLYSRDTSFPELINCVLQDNSADERGGAMFNAASASAALVNCTLEGNSAEIEGGGIYNEDSLLSLSNCILWGHGAGTAADQILNVGTGTVNVSYSDIQGGWSGTGNINADPMFVDAAGGELWLRPGSPAIDAGDNNAIPSGVTTDLGGNPRFVDIPSIADTGNGTAPMVDMGAYEALPPVLLPVTLRNYDPFTNGGFESGWTGWTQGGTLPRAISSAEVHEGVYAALLGSPAYNCRGGVPVGSAWIQQTFVVPEADVSALRIWYRIYSEDAYSETKYDRFQILVNGVVVTMDGNQSGTWGCDPGPQSAGWESFDLNLSPYLGQSITLRLENVSADNWFNTWTYVDDLQFLP